MRILVMGFVAFCLWSAISTYIYVCKIKGLCYEPVSMQAIAATLVDSIAKPLAKEPATIPANLVVHFAFDKSGFLSDSASDKYFINSKSFLDQDSEARIRITGHTDAFGTDEYNKSLGFRRAQSMQQYFRKKGIHENKIILYSKGEKDPVDINNTSSGRANNRRAVITINK